MSKPAVKSSCSFREMIEGKDTDTTVSPEFQLEPVEVLMLEMEDVLFHLDSAVMMPERPKGKSSSDGTEDDATDPDDAKLQADQDKVSGLQALALALKQFEFDPDKRLLIAGHADTSGGETMNFQLSDQRARNVLYLLEGDRDKWAKVSQERHRIEDYQQILMYVKDHRSWSDCDPVKMDDKWSDDVSNAIAAFITHYNVWITEDSAPKGRSPIPVGSGGTHEKIKNDNPKHKWPLEMWLAVYDIFNDEIAAALQVDRTRLDMEYRSRLQFCDDKKKCLSCGESYPIDDAEKSNYRSQVNRRVELFFFDPENVPKIDCPARVDTVHTAPECPMWHKYHFKRVYADADDLTSVAYHLKFIFFDRVSKKWRDVPDGLTIKAYENHTDEINGTRLKYSRGVYILKVPDAPSSKRKDIHFAFEMRDAWIYSADGADTVIETKAVSEAREGGKTLRLTKEGGVEKWDKLMPLDKRIHYYDLPEGWSSQNYWTRYDGDVTKGDRFAKVLQNKKFKPYGGQVTSKGQPLVFSLDDIVLVAGAGSQAVEDSDTAGNCPLSEHSRIALLYLDQGDKYKVKVYSPFAKAAYWSEVDFKENLIVKHADETRAVVFCNGFYHVYDSRTSRDIAFDPNKHVFGARAAVLNDPLCSAVRTFGGFGGNKANPPPDAANAYVAVDCGNYELHFLQNAAVDNGTTYSALVLFWNCRFTVDAASGGTALDKTHYEEEGMANAMTRFASKDYELHKLTDPDDLVIKTGALFEAKLDTVDGSGNRVTRGGAHRCMVRLVSDAMGSNMGNTTSRFRTSGYSDEAKPFGSGPTAPDDPINNVADYDGSKTKRLTVAHEIGHALGRDDEYMSSPAGYYPLPKYEQYYDAMPYEADKLGLMSSNHALRMRHFWGFVNWINDEGQNTKSLHKFLNGSTFKIVFSDLVFELTNNKYRDIYKPPHADPNHDFGSDATHSHKSDLFLYKLGDDEFAHLLTAGQVYKGMLNVRTFLSITFDGISPGAAAWNPPANLSETRTWLQALDKDLKIMLNDKYRLECTNAANDFANAYVRFIPHYEADAGAADPKTHYQITVVKNGTDNFAAAGNTITVGNNVKNRKIIRYLFGKSADDADLTDADLTLLADWVKSAAGDNFAVKVL